MSPVAEGVGVVRELLAQAERACLATVNDAGAPYASLVLVAENGAGNPLLLLSELAEHTKNFRRDPRAALLVEPREAADPLAATRATLLGTIARLDDDAARARFVAKHPSSARYAGFADFALYQLTVERVHLVAGFGRIAWIEGAAYHA